MFKFLVWHVLVVVVSCELFSPEVGYNIEYAPKYDNYKPRDYHFSYAVSDPHTGDHKSQWEVKIDGVVRGGYSLLEPDGTTRVVEYIADDHGFRAVVKKIGVAVHPTPVQHAVVPLPEINNFKTYNGEAGNYANVEVQPVLYRLEQSLGGGGGIEVPSGNVISRPQAFGTIEEGRGIEVPSATIEEGNLEKVVVPQQVPLAYGRVETIPYSVERVGTVEGLRLTHTPLEVLPVAQAVPPNQIHSLGGGLGQGQESVQGGRIDAYLQPYQLDSLGRVEGGLGQGQGGRIEAPPQQEQVEVVPPYQIHSLGGVGGGLGQGQERRIEAPLQQVVLPYQIHSLGGVGGGLGLSEGGRIETPLQQERVEVVPPYQTHSLGGVGERIEAPLQQEPPYQGHISGRVEGLGQIQGSADGGYRIDTNYGQVQGQISTDVGVAGHGISNKIEAVPQRLEPIGPSYQTSIVYGLTGNPEDDSRYTKDEYRGSSSQKVSNVVPAPGKRHSVVKQPLKEQFLIYLPDSPSKN